MQAREADATITAVLGHPPEEIAQTFQDPSFGSQPQAVRVPCGAPWDLLVALHHTKPEKGDEKGDILFLCLGFEQACPDALTIPRKKVLKWYF